MHAPRHAPLVVSTRGGTVELVHYGSIAIVDEKGRLVASAGDPRSLNFTRSALKPFQALPFVEDGGLEALGFGSRELALMCASHSGEPKHLSLARRMLARVRARVSDLQCGSHAPAFYAATGKAPPQRRWSALCHNCSGKHTGFLCWCRLHGRPLREYLDPGSPLQRRIRATLQRLLPSTRFARGTDGCGAPNYAMPLARIAQLYARLACDAQLGAQRDAMTRHPELVSGTKRIELALARAGRGDWVAKGGAAGLQAIGVRSRGLGIAIRIADGDRAAVTAATLRVLELLRFGDVAHELEPFRPGAVRNDRGKVVGRVETSFTLRHTG